MTYLRKISPGEDKRVLVIGGAGVDIVGRLDAGMQRRTSNPGQICTSFGGVARNVAENLARLGQPVSLITAIGQDEVGNRLIQGLDEAGVNTEAILRVPQHDTGSYLAVIDQDGELQFALDDMRAMDELSSECLREHFDLFKDAALLFLDANLIPRTLRTAMSLARRAGIPVCADPTSVTLAERLRPYLQRILLVTPNSAETSILCDPPMEVEDNHQALNAAKYLVGQGVDIALITLAEQGLCYATSETSGYIPALRTEIVDPTGAGDALSATVMFALLNDIPLDDAVRLGVSAASLTLRHRSSVFPDLSLEKLYDQLVI